MILKVLTQYSRVNDCPVPPPHTLVSSTSIALTRFSRWRSRRARHHQPMREVVGALCMYRLRTGSTACVIAYKRRASAALTISLLPSVMNAVSEVRKRKKNRGSKRSRLRRNNRRRQPRPSSPPPPISLPTPSLASPPASPFYPVITSSPQAVTPLKTIVSASRPPSLKPPQRNHISPAGTGGVYEVVVRDG